MLKTLMATAVAITGFANVSAADVSHCGVEHSRFNPIELSSYQECWLDVYKADETHGVLGSLFWVKINDVYYSTTLSYLRNHGAESWIADVQAEVIETVLKETVVVAEERIVELEKEIVEVEVIIEDMTRINELQSEVDTLTAEIESLEEINNGLDMENSSLSAMIEDKKAEIVEIIEHTNTEVYAQAEIVATYIGLAYGTTEAAEDYFKVSTAFGEDMYIMQTNSLDELFAAGQKSKQSVINKLQNDLEDLQNYVNLNQSKIDNYDALEMKLVQVMLVSNVAGDFNINAPVTTGYISSVPNDSHDIEIVIGDDESLVFGYDFAAGVMKKLSDNGLFTDISNAVEAAYDEGFDDGYKAGYVEGFKDGVDSVHAVAS